MIERLSELIVRSGTACVPSPPRSSGVLDLFPGESSKRTFWAGAGAVGVHALIIGLSLPVGTVVAQGVSAAPIPELVEIEFPPEPPPEPEVIEEPNPSPPSRPSDPLPPIEEPLQAQEEEPAATDDSPPAPAEAGEVLTAEEEVIDFGDQVISGRGDNFAGGATSAEGTSKIAVRNPNARSGGVVGGRGSALEWSPPPPINRSRAPRLAGAMQWSCPFPPEADMEQIDRATVSLHVQVTAAGKVEKVTVTDDPGFGFGRVAKQCAFRKRWDPGFDRLGRPTEATARLRVQFQRQ